MRRGSLLPLALGLALLAGCAAPAGETPPPSDSPAVTAAPEPDFPRAEAADLERMMGLRDAHYVHYTGDEGPFGYLIYRPETDEEAPGPLYALCAADGSWVTDYCFTEVCETAAGAAGFLAPAGEDLLCYDTAGNVIFDSRDYPAIADAWNGARGFLAVQEGYFPQQRRQGWALMDLQGNDLPLPEGGRLEADPCMSLGLTVVEMDGEYGYWDGTAWAIEPRFLAAEPFLPETELAVVRMSSSLHQAVDAQGHVVFEAFGELEIHPLPDGSWYYRVENPDAVAWYDPEGRPVETPFPWPADALASPLIPGDCGLVLPLETAAGDTLVTTAGEPVLAAPCDRAEVLFRLGYWDTIRYPANWHFLYSLKKKVYDPADAWSNAYTGYTERYAICAADGSWCTDFLFSLVCDTPLGAVGFLPLTVEETLAGYKPRYAVCYDQAGNVIFDSRDWDLPPELRPDVYSLVNSLTREGIFTLADGSLLDVRTGRVRTPPAGVFEVGTFSCGLAKARNEEGLWGYVDKNFRWVIPPQYDWAEAFYPELGVALARVGPKPGAYTLYLIDTAGNRLEPHGRDIQISIRAEGGWYCTVTDVWGGKTYYDQDMQPLESPDPGLPMEWLCAETDEDGYRSYYRRDIVNGTLYLYRVPPGETGAEVYGLEGKLLVTGADRLGTPTAGLFPCTQDGFRGWKDESGEWRVKSEE